MNSLIRFTVLSALMAVLAAPAALASPFTPVVGLVSGVTPSADPARSDDKLVSVEKNLSAENKNLPNVIVTTTKVYMWRDGYGTTHYTDDPKKAPRQAKIHEIQTLRQGESQKPAASSNTVVE